MAELRGLVGEEAAIYEPTIHSLRRLALQRQLGKHKAKNEEIESKSPLDEDWGKWSLESVSITNLIKWDEQRPADSIFVIAANNSILDSRYIRFCEISWVLPFQCPSSRV